MHSLHKINIQIYRNVSAFRTLHLPSISRVAASLLTTTKHLLKLFKNIAETTLLLAAEATSLTATWEATKAFEGITLTTEWILSLLVTSHARLIIDTSLLVITQSFVRVVNRSEFVLCLRGFIDVGVVLLSELEVSFLNLV